MSDRVMVPVTLVKPFMEELVEARHYWRDNGVHDGGLSILSEQTGIPLRTLHAIRMEERNVTLRVLDQLLAGTDNEGLSWVPLAEGGFLECYQGQIEVRPAPNAGVPRVRKKRERTNGVCVDCGNQCDRRSKRCSPCRFKTTEDKERRKNWNSRQGQRERRAEVLGKIGADGVARLDSRRPDYRGDIDLSGIMSPR